MLTLPLDIAVSGGGRLASSENWSPLYILAPLQRSGTGRFRFRYTRPTGSQETFIISKKGQPTTFALGISSVTGHLLHSIKWRNWRLLFGAWQPTLGFPRPSLFSFIVIDFFVYPSPFNPAFDFFPHPPPIPFFIAFLLPTYDITSHSGIPFIWTLLFISPGVTNMRFDNLWKFIL